MTVIRPNSISGITSLTAHRGSIDFYAHDGSAARFDNINSNVTSGVSTFASLNITGDLDVGGALTYEDVTNIDSVGVITARAGVNVTGGSLTVDAFSNTANNYLSLRNGYVPSASGGMGFMSADHSGSNADGVAIYGHDGISLYTAQTERLRITADGDVGIGTDNTTTTGFGRTIRIKGSSTSSENSGLFAEGYSGNAWFGFYSGSSTTDTPALLYPFNGALRIGTTNSVGTSGFAERLRIDSSGRLNIGSSSAPGTVGGFSHINVHGTGINANGAIGLYRNSASPSAGQGIGAIYFANSDGNPGAYIQGQSDGTWGTNDYPGRLVFFTTSDGASSATERLRITSSGSVIQIGAGSVSSPAVTLSGTGPSHTLVTTSTGKIGINESNPSYRLHIKETTSSSNYALVENTTAGNAGLRIKNSQGDYVVFVGPDFRVYDWTNSVDRLRIDSSGRILKGMSSSILGSSDVQLTGSGGPAKIAGYKSDNNPTANTSMLTVTGYSQSGSTFTGIGEIDFRVDQGSNTASGYHPGSIVTRVNGGSTTGTHAGQTYSYAGLKDRERIAFKSKRYYPVPEWSSGNDTYNTFREEWDYQHYVGYNQYSWYRFTSHSSSSSRGGSVDIRVTWSTRHAGGNGYGHYAFHWRDSHANGYMEIGNVYRYHLNYLGGSYYGWSGSPQLDVYEINDSGNTAGFYLRVQGHISANGNTYDGGVMHQFTISAHTNRYGADVNKFEFVGNSTPSDVGSLQGLVNLP